MVSLRNSSVSYTHLDVYKRQVDYRLVEKLASTHSFLVVLEENVLQGGYGIAVKAWVQERHPNVKVLTVGLPDAYVEHGNVSVLRETLGIRCV